MLSFPAKGNTANIQDALPTRGDIKYANGSIEEDVSCGSDITDECDAGGIQSYFTSIIAEGLSIVHAVNVPESWGNVPTWFGSLNFFEGLHGYWLIADIPDHIESISFIFNMTTLEDPVESARKVSPIAEKPLGLDFAQSSEQAFYYIGEPVLENTNVANGDWFVSYCGSTITGSRKYTGEMIDIPVMGYDGHHSTAGYCECGDTPEFKLIKSETGEMIDLYSITPSWESNGIFFLNDVRETDPMPYDFNMLSAYPNPFNPVTNIGFEVPRESLVEISIFNLRGEKVADLVNGFKMPGTYSINWDANNVASGIYFVHFTASGDGFTPVSNIQKLMLVK